LFLALSNLTSAKDELLRQISQNYNQTQLQNANLNNGKMQIS